MPPPDEAAMCVRWHEKRVVHFMNKKGLSNSDGSRRSIDYSYSTAAPCLIGLREACRQLGIKEKTLYAWVHTRKIKYIKIGALLKFDQRDINEFIGTRKIQPINYELTKLDNL